jgi:hypothetical protein
MHSTQYLSAGFVPAHVTTQLKPTAAANPFELAGIVQIPGNTQIQNSCIRSFYRGCWECLTFADFEVQKLEPTIKT